MSGAAYDTGDAILYGLGTGILAALGSQEAPTAEVVSREPLGAAPTPAPRPTGTLIAGMSIGTLALLGLGIYAIVKLAK